MEDEPRRKCNATRSASLGMSVKAVAGMNVMLLNPEHSPTITWGNAHWNVVEGKCTSG